jgi:intraflagellar transport protein 81
MLQRLPELQKRAYLARFLVNVEVPEHMFNDDEIVEVYQNYKDLQEQFKEVHKSSEKYKSQLISPNEIKKAIMQMEEDKLMLQQKVEGLQTKLSDHERFDEMLEATKRLRLQMDEQVKLQDRLKEQKAQLLQAEARLHAMQARANEKRDERGSDPVGLLDRLEREVQGLERRALEELPQEIQRKQRRMEELQQLLAEPSVSDGELAQMAQQQQQLARAVQQLEDRKRQANSNPDDKLAMFKQQANLVAKKKDALLQRLSTVGRERAAVEAELGDKAQDLE